MRVNLGSHYSDSEPLEEADKLYYPEWAQRRSEVNSLVGPLLSSSAFSRLSEITFLGILSPRFSHEEKNPLYRNRHKAAIVDGSRGSHSLGVALIATDLARSLRLSNEVIKYAAAWALIHDIGNWPFSHTGEFAFAQITGFTAREVRRMIVAGARVLPPELTLDRELRSIGLNPTILLSILEHRPHELTDDFRALAVIAASPLTPDMLEGMWRCGRVFGESVPTPVEVASSIVRDSFGNMRVTEVSKQTEPIIRFWRAKSRIYKHYINRSSAIVWESAWSRAILHGFKNIELVDSLLLSETDVLKKIRGNGLDQSMEISRYKDPIEYFVNSRRRNRLPSTCLQDLETILASRRLRLS